MELQYPKTVDTEKSCAKMVLNMSSNVPRGTSANLLTQGAGAMGWRNGFRKRSAERHCHLWLSAHCRIYSQRIFNLGPKKVVPTLLRHRGLTIYGWSSGVPRRTLLGAFHRPLTLRRFSSVKDGENPADGPYSSDVPRGTSAKVLS